MDIEEILTKAILGTLSFDDFEQLSIAQRLTIEDSFNQLSLLIAKRFELAKLSYADCDFAMNCVWPIMLDYSMKKGIPLVEPCYEIYCAFDAGEFDHGDGADPVVKYTVPAVKAVLGQEQQ